jgi:hypothetical protein
MDGIMTVGEVVESRAEGLAIGDTVWHALGWRDYAVVEAGQPALGGLGTLTRLDTDLASPQSYLEARDQTRRCSTSVTSSASTQHSTTGPAQSQACCARPRRTG